MENTEGPSLLPNDSALDFNQEVKKWGLEEKSDEVHC